MSKFQTWSLKIKQDKQTKKSRRELLGALKDSTKNFRKKEREEDLKSKG